MRRKHGNTVQLVQLMKFNEPKKTVIEQAGLRTGVQLKRANHSRFEQMSALFIFKSWAGTEKQQRQRDDVQQKIRSKGRARERAW